MIIAKRVCKHPAIPYNHVVAKKINNAWHHIEGYCYALEFRDPGVLVRD